MSTRIDKEAVLAVLRDRAPRAVHHGEIVSKLGAGRDQRGLVLDLLDELVSLRLIKEMPGRRFRATPQKSIRVRPTRARQDSTDTVEGRITMHPNGFAFVAADDGGPDVFIPARDVGAAMQADRVRVAHRPSPKGREGVVLEVLEHGVRRIGGILRRAGGNTWIDPDDPRLRGPIVVVGALPEDAKPGLQVVGEIVRHPRLPDEVPEVTVVETLGASGLTEVEVRKLKIRDGVVEEFPGSVIREAQGFPKSVTKAEKNEREDLRGYDLCTIDPSDARDHDDALWAERMSDGGYRVLIAIADVSHYVRPGTAIDQEAFERGCSIYLPDRAIPMLPPELSSHLASLVPNKDRLTMAVMVELGPKGAVRDYRFIEGVMRSKARLTYDGVARALGMSDAPKRQKEAESRLPMLETLRDAAGLLKTRRERRGSLSFDLPEPRVKLDEETNEPLDCYRQKGDPGIKQAYSMVEEMMLLANEVVAEHLKGHSMPAVYRIHGKPDEDKLLKVCTVAKALGENLDPEDAVNPRLLSRFLRRIEGKPIARTLHYLLLRAMQQASYDTKCVGHFALAAKYYCHFTSPIRRYPDLCVHRALRTLIRGDAFDDKEMLRDMKRAAVEASRLERRAMKLERDVTDLYRCILMRDRVGEEFDAQVSGMSSYGFYSSFDEPFVDAKTPVERLSDFYELDELEIRMVGQRSGMQYELGDRIRVQLESVSIEQRQLIAFPLDELDGVREESTGDRRPRQGRRGRDGGGGRDPKGNKARVERASRGRRERRKEDDRRRGKKDDSRGKKKGGGPKRGAKPGPKRKRSSKRGAKR